MGRVTETMADVELVEAYALLVAFGVLAVLHCPTVDQELV